MATFSSGYSAALGDILSQVNDAFSGKSAGIDVSGVVNELMQVEDQPMTQMQSEQTTINSQISALTTINTELTALQSSVQALEDPIDGALGQMTTGSSDSSIVAASAANTATAGTHTVTVSQLATTSSSYSGYIASGSSLAGAEIQVQYGNPSDPTSTDTINIPSSDTTLQDAATYINQPNYNQIAAGNAAATSSSAVSGTITVSAGGATVFTSAGGEGTVGALITEINNAGAGLTASLNNSGQLVITDTQNRGSSTQPLTVTGTNFEIGSDKSNETFTNTSYGVTANVVTDSVGSRLVLTSNTSGAAGNLTVSSSATNFTTAAGVDAQLTVDGVPVDSSTNTVTGAISGVTLSLGATGSTQISVEPDTNGAATAIQNFVTDYNDVMNSINSQYTLNSSGNEGVLAGDSMVETLQSELLNLVSTSVSGVGQYTNLQSMGIEMQNDGTLQIDSSTLSDALSSDYSDVQNFFTSTSPQGWGQIANTEMTQLTDPTQGPVAVDINGLNQTNDDLSTQISDFQANMTVVQQQLTTQYDNLDTLLMQYPLEMQEAQDQLASLPNSPTTTNSNSTV